MVKPWGETFMNLARSIAEDRSSCERLKVGCIIVDDSNRIVSMGYNGHLSSAPQKSIVRDGHEQTTVHAEINAITFCAKNSVSSNGCTAYVTHYPCINCTKALWQCGIKKIYYETDYKNDELIAQVIPVDIENYITHLPRTQSNC